MSESRVYEGPGANIPPVDWTLKVCRACGFDLGNAGPPSPPPGAPPLTWIGVVVCDACGTILGSALLPDPRGKAPAMPRQTTAEPEPAKPCPYCQQDCAPESVRCSGCGCPLRLDPSFTPEELRTWAQKLREQAAAHEEHAQELREYVERRRNERPGKEQER